MVSRKVFHPKIQKVMCVIHSFISFRPLPLRNLCLVSSQCVAVFSRQSGASSWRLLCSSLKEFFRVLFFSVQPSLIQKAVWVAFIRLSSISGFLLHSFLSLIAHPTALPPPPPCSDSHTHAPGARLLLGFVLKAESGASVDCCAG